MLVSLATKLIQVFWPKNYNILKFLVEKWVRHIKNGVIVIVIIATPTRIALMELTLSPVYANTDLQEMELTVSPRWPTIHAELTHVAKMSNAFQYFPVTDANDAVF